MCAPISSRTSDLSSIASAVGHFSRTKYSGVYTTISLDRAANNIKLYVTDLIIGQAIVEETKQRNPDIDVSKIVLVKSSFSRKQFQEQMQRIWDDPKSDTYEVNSMSASTDGTHLTVRVTGEPGAAIAANASDNETWLSGPDEIPVIVISGPPVRTL